MAEKWVTKLTFIKGAETYLWFYERGSPLEAILSLGRLASNPELNFSWYDAAVLSGRMRDEAVCWARGA